MLLLWLFLWHQCGGYGFKCNYLLSYALLAGASTSRDISVKVWRFCDRVICCYDKLPSLSYMTWCSCSCVDIGCHTVESVPPPGLPLVEVVLCPAGSKNPCLVCVVDCHCTVHKKCHGKVIAKCPGSAKDSMETKVRLRVAILSGAWVTTGTCLWETYKTTCTIMSSVFDAR